MMRGALAIKQTTHQFLITSFHYFGNGRGHSQISEGRKLEEICKGIPLRAVWQIVMKLEKNYIPGPPQPHLIDRDLSKVQ